VTVLATGVRRYPCEIESAAYFCCLEAMQNAARHARDATVVVVELCDEDGVLSVEARDDGDGFDERAVTPGAGLANMRERILAVGGVATIDSRPGRGTRVRARIPLG
jgi:signal transduction histidine kinase